MDWKANLTPRQIDVAALIAEGFTDREIADRLAVGSDTVRVHACAIRAALGAGNRTQVALIVKTGRTPDSMKGAAA